MNEDELKFFRNMLEEKQTQASADLEELERVSRSEDAQESSEDRSAYSLHMADRGTDAMEREKNMLLAQREGDYLDHVDQALQRIDDGTFGICRVCSGDIGRLRLEAVPTTTWCIECKPKAKSKEDGSAQ